MNLPQNNIKFNLQFWLAYFGYEWLANASYANEYYDFFITALIIVPVTFVASIVTVHVLIKYYYLKNKKTLFWFGMIVSMIIFMLIRRGLNYYVLYPLYYQDGQSMPFLFPPKLVIECVNVYLIVALYAMFYFIQAWYEQRQLVHTLVQKRTEAELQLLKAQVQPHFIFNTLNNIYSYAVRKNEKTPELIHGLSSFLSYNLYESQSQSIALTKEVEYIKSYIELEKIRYGDRLDVSVNMFNDPVGFYIAPLLLLPLVENCFKHGATLAISKSWIRFDLSIQHDWLTIKIENSIGEKILKKDSVKNGLGLENVKKRLQIIYPDQHEFKLRDNGDSFMVILKLKNLSYES